MTVRELVEKLSEYPSDMLVAVWDMGYGGLNRGVFIEKDTDEGDTVLAIGGLSPDEQEVSDDG